MPKEDASIRQDLIENGVQRQVMPIEETVATEQEVGAAFDTEIEHDLTVWPREYLEPYLNTDDQGRIPLNEAGLQDLLEAAFDRNEQIFRSLQKSRAEMTAGTVNQRNRNKPASREAGSLGRFGSFEAAQAQAHSLLGPSAETRYPLIENGVYVGNIISETAEYLVQRISGSTAILHPKSMFSDLPQVGHVVRIAYYYENVAVREMATRQISKELAR